MHCVLCVAAAAYVLSVVQKQLWVSIISQSPPPPLGLYRDWLITETHNRFEQLVGI